IVKLRLEPRNRSSPSVEFGNSLPRRWTRHNHASEIRLAGLESCFLSVLINTKCKLVSCATPVSVLTTTRGGPFLEPGPAHAGRRDRVARLRVDPDRGDRDICRTG